MQRLHFDSSAGLTYTHLPTVCWVQYAINMYESFALEYNKCQDNYYHAIILLLNSEP